MLKKIDLELILPKYSPVSNLLYISKMIEKAVSMQLMKYTERTRVTEQLQSAYKSNNSTETALLKINTDLLDAIDRKEVTGLLLLDLSAAFDTISQRLLLNRLHYHYGIQDVTLEWIKNYLTNRKQKVIVQTDRTSATSYPTVLNQEVPQGSILDPILFTLYVAPIGDICRKHQISFHGYVDDMQNYLSFKPMTSGNKELCRSNLEALFLSCRFGCVQIS